MKFIKNIEQINDTTMYVTKYTRKEIEGKLDNHLNSINTINNNITTINTNITKLTSNINELNELTGNLKLEHVKNTRVSYIIDQRGGISDPDDMVKGNYYNHPTLGLIKIDDGAFTGNSKYDFLTWLKENTHAYVSKQTATGLRLKQLDDTDRTKFADGTSSVDYINGTIENCDVFIKFPCDIYYKCEPAITAEQPTPNEDYVLITLAKELEEGEKEEDWNKYSQYNLIGVYQACQINNKLYSLSGKRPINKISQINSIATAKARGLNFNICDYDMTRLFAFLFYGYYSSLGCQQICGYGTENYTSEESHPKITGSTDELNMTDTDTTNGNGAAIPNEDQIKAGIGSDIKSVNFWGIEECWGDLYEWISNLRVMEAYRPTSNKTPSVSNYVADYLDEYDSVIITKQDGIDETYTSKAAFLEDYTVAGRKFFAITDKNNNLVRLIDMGVSAVTMRYIKKMLFGTHADITAKAYYDRAGADTGFCDHGEVCNAGSVAVRSCYSDDPRGGVGYLSTYFNANEAHHNIGARLLYEGSEEIIHIIDDATEEL